MRIPVSIITGFLGSGKTTLLNRLLQHPALADSAVIINEFGEIGLDHLLVSTPAENMVLLASGCLCCTIRGDLVETLGDLHAKRASGQVAFSSVVVETTGLADPVPIIQTVASDKDMARHYRLRNVVTLADGVHGMDQLDRNMESVKQAAVADALIISKPDLAGAARVRRLRDRLARLNPGADVHEATHGALDPGFLFKEAPRDTAAGPDVEDWLKESAFVQVGGARAGHGGHRRRQGLKQHDERIRSFCLYYDRPITRAGLVMWMTTLAGLRGANLLRVKGLLNVDGEPVVIHAVQTIVHEPVTLTVWPDAERRSRIVFITRDLERAELEATFDAFNLAPVKAGPAVDPRAYADFLQAMKGFR